MNGVDLAERLRDAATWLVLGVCATGLVLCWAILSCLHRIEKLLRGHYKLADKLHLQVSNIIRLLTPARRRRDWRDSFERTSWNGEEKLTDLELRPSSPPPLPRDR